MVLWRIRGRGRLVLRWERAQGRSGLPVEESFRRHLVREHEQGRMSLAEVEYRYGRFLDKRQSVATLVEQPRIP